MSLVTSGPQLLSDSASDAVNATFIARVAVAAAAMAQAVFNESGTVTGHPSRAAYARQVQANPLTVATNEIAWAVVSDKATGVGSSDQLILDRIEALWNNLSNGY
jgi:hypothetical protein